MPCHCVPFRWSHFVFLAIAIAFTCSVQAHAQTPTPQGITPWSTQIQAGSVSVDMQADTMVMRIAILSKRGAIPYSFEIFDDINTEGYLNSDNAFLGRVSSINSGMVRPNPTSCGSQSLGYSQQYGVNAITPVWYLMDGTGSRHYFSIPDGILVGPQRGGLCNGDYGPITVVAGDGSGYTAVVTGSSSPTGVLTWVVYDKGGNMVSNSNPGIFSDTDGNSIGSTDTLGQPTVAVSLGRSTGNPDTYSYTDINGGTQTYTVSYTTQHIKTIFGCSGNPYDIDKTGVYLPSSVTLPTGAKYVITYEDTPGFSGDVTGRLKKVTLPSGGYVSFAYSGGHGGGLNGFDCNYQTIPQLQVSENDNNGHTSTTTYVNTYSSSGLTETDSLGDVTTHSFTGVVDTQKIVSDVSRGQLSKTVISCGTCGAGGTRISQTDVYTYPGTSTSPSLVETKFDIYGNITEQSHWDFGATNPPTGNPVSKTTYTYDTATGPCGNLVNAYMVDRPCSITIVNSSGTMVSQTKYTYNATGHPIQTQKWISGSAYVTTSATYNANGTIATSTDARAAQTTYNYDGSCNSQLSTSTTFPTVNGVTLSTSQTWNCSGGVKTSASDANGSVTNYSYVDSSTRLPDPLWRVTKLSFPDGGSTTTTYNTGATLPWSISTSTAITSSTNLNNTTTYDGLDRVIQTQLTSDPETTDYVDTTYDVLGRKATVSNPYRAGTSVTDGIKTYSYDALNRVVKILQPDGSQLTTSYSNNCRTVTDETGQARKSCIDGLGRLSQVFEDPGSAPHLNYETDYSYDALDNLTTVTQKGGSSDSGQWRTRNFSYDGRSRLTQAVTPESGTIVYGYDGNGNLVSKVAPSPNQPSTGTSTVTTTYAYDALNRITGRTYSDSYPSNPATSPVLYGYDGKAISGCPADTPPSNTDSYGKGLRTSMCDGAEAATWTHDQMGRIKQEVRSIGTIIGQHDNDTYNLDGSVATTTSLGLQYSYTYSGAGRPISASGFVQSGSVTYAPFGGLTSAKMGPTPITITNAYNNRLQPLLISAAGSSTIMSLCYDFHLKMSIASGPCSFSANSVGDNGNVYQIVNNRDSNRTQNFLYDPLNRISQAYTSGPNWGETYGPAATNPGVQPTTSGIDAWGNLMNRSGVLGKTNTDGLSCLGDAQNHLVSCSFTYDAAGNMITNASTTYTYDAENRLIATAGMSYLYDGDGKRVEKCTAGATPGTCATNATGTLYWTGSGNDPLAETDLAGNVLENYIFFNGQRIARREPGSTPTIHFYFSDYLGSHGVVTDKTGNTCEQDIDYYPYGGVENDYCGSVAQHYKFTGKERDTESGLDNFGARYNASSLGRFMTPDPGGVGARPKNPQSWNAYEYVMNNPLKLNDPSGLGATSAGTQTEPTAAPDCNAGSDVSGCFLIDFDTGAGTILQHTVLAQYLEREDDIVPETLKNDRGEIDPNAEAERALEPAEDSSQWPSRSQCPGCVFPGDRGPLDDRNASTFKWYFKYKLEEDQTYYRQWGDPAKIQGSRAGTYYSFFPPEGSVDFMRNQMSVLPEWNSMEHTNAITIPAGTVVYIGPAAPQASYAGGGIQVFVPNAPLE